VDVEWGLWGGAEGFVALEGCRLGRRFVPRIRSRKLGGGFLFAFAPTATFANVLGSDKGARASNPDEVGGDRGGVEEHRHWGVLYWGVTRGSLTLGDRGTRAPSGAGSGASAARSCPRLRIARTYVRFAANASTEARTRSRSPASDRLPPAPPNLPAPPRARTTPGARERSSISLSLLSSSIGGCSSLLYPISASPNRIRPHTWSRLPSN
jgi:hypothetical protein